MLAQREAQGLKDAVCGNGSPKNFSLEQRKIEQTYWNLQKRLHPDLYGSKSEVRLPSFLPSLILSLGLLAYRVVTNADDIAVGSLKRSCRLRMQRW